MENRVSEIKVRKSRMDRKKKNKSFAVTTKAANSMPF